MVWGQKCSKSEDKWGKLYGPLGQWCPDKYHHAEYVSDHLLQVGPMTDLIGAKVTCVGLGNAYTRPLGYVIIWVQVDGSSGL